MKEKSLNSHLKPTIQESLWRRLLLPDQLVHVFWDLFVRHLRIDLRAGYRRVLHHFGDAFYRNAGAEWQRPERMTSHVENIIHLRNWKNIENKPVTGCELVDFLYFASVAEKQSGMEYWILSVTKPLSVGFPNKER